MMPNTQQLGGYSAQGKSAGKAADEAGSGVIVPPGKYPIMLLKVEPKQGQRKEAPTGIMDKWLEFSFSILDGAYKGLLLRNRFYYDHKNPITLSIAEQWLGKFHMGVHGDRSVPLDQIDKLMSKPVVAELEIAPGKAKPSGGNYPDSQKWKSFHKAPDVGALPASPQLPGMSAGGQPGGAQSPNPAAAGAAGAQSAMPLQDAQPSGNAYQAARDGAGAPASGQGSERPPWAS